MTLKAEGPWVKFDLTNRVAIITGGAGLLGTEYCHTLAKAGANVVVADINSQGACDLAKAVYEVSGVEALGLQTDISRPDSVKAMVETTMERFERIDILVNNAALDPKFDQEHTRQHLNRFEDFPFDAWQEALAVNVTGMFLCSQAVAPIMLGAGRGVMVNISSTYGMLYGSL